MAVQTNPRARRVSQPEYRTSPRTGARARNPLYSADPTTVGSLYQAPTPRLGQPGVSIPDNIKSKKKVPGFVPVGFSVSDFALDTSERIKNQGQVIRRNVLDAAAPTLREAIASGDIFAYNAALSNMREMLSRTDGGPKLQPEMPDPEEARRRSRLKRKPGSRELTLGLAY